MIKKTALIVALAAFLIAVPVTRACFDLTVRDAAFGEPRDVHLLGVIAAADDPAGVEIYLRLEKWLSESGQELNIELQRVDAHDPDVPWMDYGIPSAPPALPVVVLAGRGSTFLARPNFLVDHWEPGPGDEELEVLRSSPARKEICSELVLSDDTVTTEIVRIYAKLDVLNEKQACIRMGKFGVAQFDN